MGHFPLPLNVQLLNGGDRGRLLTEFMYHDPAGPSLLVSVPVGFSSDFASVRPLRNIAAGLLFLALAIGWLWPGAGAVVGASGYSALALYASVVGYGQAAAIIHDRLYATGELSRHRADRVFYNALVASGVARWRAWLMYAGVRIGGRWRYKRK